MWPHFTLDQQLVFWSIIAIASSPLIALEVQKRLDARRIRSERKLELFRRLMTSRATDLAPIHVEALNAIEIEFYATSGPDKKVLDTWRVYINHVSSRMGEGDALVRWVDKRRELLIDLIYEMGQNLGYDIDKVTLSNNVYCPNLHREVETELHALRKAALKVFSGETPVVTTVLGPVQVTPPLPPPEDILLLPKA